MTQDAYGLDLTTSNEDAAASWNAAFVDTLEHRLSAAEHVKAALAADPDFVMGLCMRAST